MQSVTSATIDKLRFAVGGDDAPHSAEWVIWTHGNDVYAGSRSIAGTMKLSLHGSGRCHYATTQQYFNRAVPGAPPERRPMFARWQRGHIPDGGVVQVVSLLFPTDYLRGPVRSGRPNKPLFLLTPGKPETTVEVGIFYSRQAPEDFARGVGRAAVPMVSASLSNGERVYVAARLKPFEAPHFVNGERLNVERGLSLPHANSLDGSSFIGAIDEMPNLTLAVFNAPADGETFMLMEFGGMSLRRNTPAARVEASDG